MPAMDIKNNGVAAYFGLLGTLLHKESNEALLEGLKGEGVFDELPYESSHPLVLKGQKRVLNWFESAPVHELADRAYNDFMMLFVGPGKLLAPPWGSSYLTKDRLLFQRETLAVREYYEKHGLMIGNKYSEPDDHIGLELLFLSHLAERNEIAAMGDFIRNHVLTWADRWHRDVELHAESDFYKGIADMALGGLLEYIQ